MRFPKLFTAPFRSVRHHCHGFGDPRCGIVLFVMAVLCGTLPVRMTIGGEATVASLQTDAPEAGWPNATASVSPTHRVESAAFGFGNRLAEATEICGDRGDRIWLINTRSLCTDAHVANLSSFQLTVVRVSPDGETRPSSYREYLGSLEPDRASLLYVHGNRRSEAQAIKRGLFAYRNVRAKPASGDHPIDWVIWSWPSDRDGFLWVDARRKAARTDTQALYLAAVLRDQVKRGQPTCMIGFSFGGRIVSGALHALAGGTVAGRILPGEHVLGAKIDVGMIAPALQSDWMTHCGAHFLSTRNCDRLVLLYNRRDAVLKGFWRLNRIRNVDALGYSGPVRFAARNDGSPLPVVARDCSPAIGRQHRESDYYNSGCQAGEYLATLIPGCFTSSQDYAR